jgi:hypothetical protein
MDDKNIQIKKHTVCKKIHTQNPCEKNIDCKWKINEGIQSCINKESSLFDQYVHVCKSKKGKEALYTIATRLNIKHDNRVIKTVCEDIQQQLHLAKYGNTLEAVAKKLKLSINSKESGNIHYDIYKHIFDKIIEYNQSTSTPQFIPPHYDIKTNTIVLEKYTMFQNRLSNYRKIKNIFKKYTNDDICIFKNTFEKIKRIGSNSRAGEAYLGYHEDKKNPQYVGIKLMPVKESNSDEVQNYLFFTNYVKKNISPHFPLIYQSVICDNCPYHNKTSFKGQCITLYSELAHGDLKNYLQHNNSSIDLVLMFGQLIMSCFALENARIIHNDLHWGNYLLHYVPEYKNKYFHYMTKTGDNIYLLNNGIVFVLWDFSDMTHAINMNDNLSIDLYRILNIDRWVIDDKYPQFPPEAAHICSELRHAAHHNYYGIWGLLNYYSTLLYSQSNISYHEMLYINPTIQNTPSHDKIINKKPFTFV